MTGLGPQLGNDAMGLLDVVVIPHLQAVRVHEVLHATPGLEELVVGHWLGVFSGVGLTGVVVGVSAAGVVGG